MFMLVLAYDFIAVAEGHHNASLGLVASPQLRPRRGSFGRLGR